MTVGTPTIDGAAVQAEVIDQIKGEKLIHFVKRRRKHGSKRTKGHRQQLTLLRVGDILASGGADTGVKEAIGAGSAPSPKVAGLPAGDEAFAGVPETASDEDKIVEAVTQGTRPANLLAAARGGKPDELTRIGGVGPKLEKLLHETGVFHFDQIAAWGPEEVAYMDDTMSLKGRVARDGWIDQAKQFAADQE
jgi:large subunit ribosomal protein L21